jgi:hypothetical protein
MRNRTITSDHRLLWAEDRIWVTFVLSREKDPEIGSLKFFNNVLRISVDECIIGIADQDYLLRVELVLLQLLFLIPHLVTHTCPGLVKS